MLLLMVGYGLAFLALATQLVLAELAVRHSAPRAAGRRWRPYLAISLSALASAAFTALQQASEVTAPVRGLEIICVAVALAGALVVVRTVVEAVTAAD